MGNYCFGRIDESTSARDNNQRTNVTNDIESVNRVRNPSSRHRNLFQEYYLPQYYENDPIFHPTPGVSRPMSQLTEEEQIVIATRLGLLSSLSMFNYDESKKEKFTECIICMCDYVIGEECRHLPCLHTFHRTCIDEWLLRSFTCPSCLDQVDTVLLSNQFTKIDSKDAGDTVCRKRKRRSASSERLSRQHSRVSQKSKAESVRYSTPHDLSNVSGVVSADSNSSSALLLNESTDITQLNTVLLTVKLKRTHTPMYCRDSFLESRPQSEMLYTCPSICTVDTFHGKSCKSKLHKTRQSVHTKLRTV